MITPHISHNPDPASSSTSLLPSLHNKMSHRRSLARQFCEDSSSEDEELMMVAIVAEEEQARLDAPRHGGSQPGRQSLQHDFAERFQNLHKDYFAMNCTFKARMFRNRYETGASVSFSP
jgi:hypothetical protein